MKTIELTQGKVAFVDDCDYNYLTQWKWCYHKGSRSTGYAIRGQYIGRTHATRKHKIILMHRVIAARIGLNIKGLQIDHIDTNKINNQRNNLRAATHGQNGANQPVRCHNTSGFKGVYRHYDRWQTRIRANGKYYYLGTWDTPEEAARAYDLAAHRHFDQFARTNFPV